jgi:hypothetical protein
VHKARQLRTGEDNHKQLQTTVVLLRVISWPRGLDFGLDSGLEQKHEDVSRRRHLDGGLGTSTAEALRGRGLKGDRVQTVSQLLEDPTRMATST